MEEGGAGLEWSTLFWWLLPEHYLGRHLDTAAFAQWPRRLIAGGQDKTDQERRGHTDTSGVQAAYS